MKIAVAVAVIFLIAGASFWLSKRSENNSENKISENRIMESQPAESEPATEIKQLQIIDVVVGTGTEAKDGSMVKVHYTGTFENGEKFDSSLDRGEPIEFQLGSGMVIKGWDMGVKGMKAGGKRKLIIPGHLAYGQQGRPGRIPPNATLLFDVELMEVKSK